MLASKSTCKDGWRLILNEAIRIPTKHLLTPELSISENPTDEIKAGHRCSLLFRVLHADASFFL